MIPKDWRDAIIIHLCKGKFTRKLCGNSRGITLLSVAGKILAFVLVLRLNQSIVDNIFPESQCDFCPHRGTADMIFTARQIMKKCYEQQLDLYQVFVVLRKAFNTVHCTGF